jgi:hypothetical protein
MDEKLFYAVILLDDGKRQTHVPDDDTKLSFAVDEGVLIVLQSDVETGEEEICSVYAPGRWIKADLTVNKPTEE